MAPQLPPWYAVATPHSDIREGRLSEDVFAVNLWGVVNADAPEVYRDTRQFFAKTYLTEGLTTVLERVSRALRGDGSSGDRILNLQTVFGGGKTHSLVALWHLAKHLDVVKTADECAQVREVVSALPDRINACAVFTHHTCNPVRGRDVGDGGRTRTVWGDLAWQLGGRELYSLVADNDEQRVVPQGVFTQVLQKAAPCLILLDEIADYCVAASGVSVGGSNLASQTVSFVQHLQEAAQQVPGVAVVATLPERASEVADTSAEHAEALLAQLKARFARLGRDLLPVKDMEILEVVRRRLFDDPGDVAEHERVADAYMALYRQHQNDVPPEATKLDYRDRIARAYPFHPALIDGFYLRWGSNHDFQRTRGVLRVLASAVGDLWSRRHNATQSQPLIQPAHLRWDINGLNATLTRLWGTAHQSVIAADVTGSSSNAAITDDEQGGDYATQRIAEGVAASVLLGSFGGQGERAGYSTKELRVCVSRPGVHWALTDGALTQLKERAHYLHEAGAGSQGTRYWFGTKPRLTRLIQQYRDRFESEEFADEVVAGLSEEASRTSMGPATWRVVVDPGDHLPEQKQLMLVVLPPACALSESDGDLSLFADSDPALQIARRLSTNCGSQSRLYRNTLLFLLPSTRGLGILRRALRDLRALETLQDEYADRLDAEQQGEVVRRLEDAHRAYRGTFAAAYPHVGRFDGDEFVSTSLINGRKAFSEHLTLVWEHVKDEEWLIEKVGALTLREANLVPEQADDAIPVRDAVEAFLRFTDKPMITTAQAVYTGLRDAAANKVIGVGFGMTRDAVEPKWCGETQGLGAPLAEEGYWVIPAFEPRPDTTGEDGQDGDGGDTYTPPVDEDTIGDPPPPPPGEPVERVKVGGAVPLESWTQIFQYLIAPANQMGMRAKLSIDFEFETSTSIPVDENDPRLRSIVESARQLGLKVEEE